MTAIATRTLKPIKRRVAEFDKTATRAAADADRAMTLAEKRARRMFGSTRSIVKQIHDRIEDKPHASVAVALAIGGFIGFLLQPRR